LWDVATWSTAAVLSGHTDLVAALAFSRDGRTLASGGDDRTVRLWDVASRGSVAVLSGHTGVVSSLAFSPGGLLASGSYDHTVRLWDGTRQVGTLVGHVAEVVSVEFGPDGHTLVSASDDRTAQLWETDLDGLEGRACALAKPVITPAEWAEYFPDLPYRAPCP
jgi:WD40 repeat protein